MVSMSRAASFGTQSRWSLDMVSLEVRLHPKAPHISIRSVDKRICLGFVAVVVVRSFASVAHTMIAVPLSLSSCLRRYQCVAIGHGKYNYTYHQQVRIQKPLSQCRCAVL